MCVTLRQCLDLGAVVGERVGPPTVAFDTERAVLRSQSFVPEGALAEVPVRDRQPAVGGQFGRLGDRAGEVSGDRRRVVGAGDRDRQRLRHGGCVVGVAVVGGRQRVGQRQRLPCGKEVEVDVGRVGPLVTRRGDRQAVAQRGPLCLGQRRVGEIAAAPRQAGVRCGDGEGVRAVAVADSQRARPAERLSALAFGQDHRLGGRITDHWPVVGAHHGHDNIGGPTAVLTEDLEGLGAGLARRQRLHGRVGGRVECVGPRAALADAEGAVGAGRSRLGDETTLTGIQIVDLQAAGGHGGRVLGDLPHAQTRDHRGVVRPGDRDDDVARDRLGPGTVTRLHRIGQGQLVAGLQKVQHLLGAIGPAPGAGGLGDLEAVDQRLPRGGIHVVGQGATTPHGRHMRRGDDDLTLRIDARDAETTTVLEQSRAVALGQRAAAGEAAAEGRLVGRADDGDGHGALGAVGAAHDEGVDDGVARAQRLHGVAGIVQLVRPDTGGVDLEAAVGGRDGRQRGLEAGLAGVGIGDLELAVDRALRHRRILGHLARQLTRDQRLVVGAGDGDGHRLRRRDGVVRATVILGRHREGQRQRLTVAQEIEVDALGGVVPSVLALPDREALLQQRDRGLVQMRGQIATDPGGFTRHDAQRDRVSDVAVEQRHRAEGGERLLAIALGQFTDRGDRVDDRLVVRAGDRQPDRGRDPVGAEHRELVAARLGCPQRLHRGVAVLQRVRPGARGVDLEGAIGRGLRAGKEDRFPGVGVADVELALGHHRGAVFGQRTLRRAGDQRRVVGARDRDGHGARDRGVAGCHAAVILRRDGVGQPQGVALAEEVHRDGAGIGPALPVAIDAETAGQRLDLLGAEGGGRLARGTGPGDFRVLRGQRQRIACIDVSHFQGAAGGQRLALRQAAGLGQRDLGSVIGAPDRDLDVLGRAVQALHLEAVDVGLPLAQGLDGGAGLERIAPIAAGAEREGPVVAGGAELWLETVLAGVLVGDGQLAADRQRGHVLGHSADELTRDHRPVVRAGDGDGDRGGRAVDAGLVGGDVAEADLAGLAGGQIGEGTARVEDIAAVHVEGQAAQRHVLGEAVAGDRSVDVGGRGHLALQHGALARAAAVVAGHRRVVGAGDGDRHRRRRARGTEIIGGGIGEAHRSDLSRGQRIEVGTRVEAVAAIGVEGQRAIARADPTDESVAVGVDRAVDVARRGDLPLQHRVLGGAVGVR